MSRTERKGTPTPVADLPGLIGTEIGVSRWITVDQARIDAFAEITEDRQFIHIDPVAAAQTPFGGTIAHGFLTLSLLSAMTYDAVPPLEGVVMGVNYGFDKLRVLAPCRRARTSGDGSNCCPPTTRAQWGAAPAGCSNTKSRSRSTVRRSLR